MKSQKIIYITESTIANSVHQTKSSQNIQASYQQNCSNQAMIQINGRFTSILNQEYREIISQFQQNYSEIHSTQKQCEILHQYFYANPIIQILSRIFLKKKRYCLQVLKQFILFPEDSASSIISLSSYDPLIFQDEVIHTLVKILETKLIQRKIWGFLNLKMRPYIQAAIIIEEKATKIHKRQINQLKKQTFQIIKKTVAVQIQPIQHFRNLQHVTLNFSGISITNFQKSSVKGSKQIHKNLLESRTISSAFVPTSPIKQIKANNEYDNKSRIIKINSSENYYSPNVTKVYSSIQEYYKQKQITPPSSTHQSRRQYFRSPSKIQTNTTKIQIMPSTYRIPVPTHLQVPARNYEVNQKLTKINIINYYERPRKHDTFNSGQMRYEQICECSKIRSHCCQCQLLKNQCYLSCESVKRNHLIDEMHHEKQSFINTTSHSYKRPNFKAHNILQMKNSNLQSGTLKQLSELQSRIQYLNFLKKIAKQQQRN